MTYLATLLLTLLVIGVALWGFVKLGVPVYRIERINLIALLELVQNGKATPNDWNVFLSFPIRHDPELAEIQLSCAEISEREYLGYEKKLFTDRGLRELRLLLTQLQGLDNESSR